MKSSTKMVRQLKQYGMPHEDSLPKNPKTPNRHGWSTRGGRLLVRVGEVALNQEVVVVPVMQLPAPTGQSFTESP